MCRFFRLFPIYDIIRLFNKKCRNRHKNNGLHHYLNDFAFISWSIDNEPLANDTFTTQALLNAR